MTDLLSKLPLFATDREIAVAVVGKERAAMYVKVVIPMLERQGFPRIDPLHDGRPTLLVRRFYDGYLGITAGFQVAAPDGEDKLSEWKGRQQRRNERRPQLGLNARCLGALRYMVEHPDVRTSVEVPRATDFTMKELAGKGALKEGSKDPHGDRTWTVTDAGREEMARVNDWHGGRRRL
ncbi:hypothetical protein MNR02_08775 [Shinella sp. H4-D48]|uniref:hypothetical protein n=1 Tax=Shinella sp. H4-D48 TaxID=2925841 RepID=UPI001F5368FB|nr:hypothetical protein [Shinella sp. H4-D48]UNK36607.1 hypothetical protein MNR02_08775 [Shinella sp. H4-D48]